MVAAGDRLVSGDIERRLAEIAEKYSASHSIRPYRLHLIDVPALRLTADVRRGDRRYPMAFDWLLPAGAFAPEILPGAGWNGLPVAARALAAWERVPGLLAGRRPAVVAATVNHLVAYRAHLSITTATTRPEAARYAASGTIDPWSRAESSRFRCTTSSRRC